MTLRVARTIADLAVGEPNLPLHHPESIQCEPRDRDSRATSGQIPVGNRRQEPGRLRSFGGGNAYSDIITDVANGTYYRRKHIAGCASGPLSLEIGSGMGTGPLRP